MSKMQMMMPLGPISSAPVFAAGAGGLLVQFLTLTQKTVGLGQGQPVDRGGFVAMYPNYPESKGSGGLVEMYPSSPRIKRSRSRSRAKR